MLIAKTWNNYDDLSEINKVFSRCWRSECYGPQAPSGKPPLPAAFAQRRPDESSRRVPGCNRLLTRVWGTVSVQTACGQKTQPITNR